jgi:solute carrier family 45 protein 1/2/4
MALGILTSSLRALKNIKDEQYHKVLGLVSTRISDDDEDYAYIRQRKTRWELVRLSAAVCGIEFCYAAETAFVSPTLLKIGVHVVYMTLIWCLSPILGFTLVPILGSLSDKCRMKLGRRRPFILLLSVGIVVGLLLVPNGKTFGILLGDKYIYHPDQQAQSFNASQNLINFTFLPDGLDAGGSDFTDSNLVAATPAGDATTPTHIPSHSQPHPWSILFTVLGVILLDFNCDACQSPCRYSTFYTR